jgi:hypothetical protein
MSVMEAYAGIEFLYNTLIGDTTLMALVTGVHRDKAPDAAVPPFVILSHQAGSDTLTANAIRLMTRSLYQVVVLGPDSMSPQMAAAAARIDVLLKRTNGSVTGAAIDACYREMPLLLGQPPVNGLAWSKMGGLYRLEIQAT